MQAFGSACILLLVGSLSSVASLPAGQSPPLEQHQFQADGDLRQSMDLPLPLPNDYLYNEERFELPPDFDLWNKLRDGWSTSSFIILPQFQHVNPTSGRINADEVEVRYTPLLTYTTNEPSRGSSSFSGPDSSKEVFASHLTIEHSVTPSSPTVLIDAVTGQAVEHYVEVLTAGKYGNNMQGQALVDKSMLCKHVSHGISQEFRRLMGKSMEHLVDQIIASLCTRSSSLLNDPSKSPQVLLIRPAQTLVSGRRYIVALKQLPSAIRKGEYVETPHDFQIIRDDMQTSSQEILRKKHYFAERQIIEIIVNNGHVAYKEQLTYAWDFTTASTKTSTETLAYMRDTVLDLIAESSAGRLAGVSDAFSYTVTSTVDDVSALIYRKVEGSFKMPMFLNTAVPTVTAKLNRPLNASYTLERLRPGYTRDGRTDTVDVPFIFWIPRTSVKSANASILQYGHGLFANRYESTVPFSHQLISDTDSVAIASDWWGLSDADTALVREIVQGDIIPVNGKFIPWQDRVGSLMDRAAQGIVNKLALAELVRVSSDMHNDPRIFNIGGRCIFRRASDGNVDKSVFYGISLGGILGTTYMALTETIQTGIIGVPGAPFSTLINRNPQGDLLYSIVLPFLWKTSQDRAKLLLMVTQLFDFVDPASFSHAVGRLNSAAVDTVPKPKQILVQATVGDALVSPIGMQFLMRTMGAVNVDGDSGPTQSVYRAWFKNRPHDLLRYGWVVPTTNATVTAKPQVATLSDADADTMRSMTPHRVALQMFHYNNPSILPLSPVSPNIVAALLWDDHSCPRFTPEGKRQVKWFIDQYRFNHCENDYGPLYVEPACGLGGCWNLPRPPLDF